MKSFINFIKKTESKSSDKENGQNRILLTKETLSQNYSSTRSSSKKTLGLDHQFMEMNSNQSTPTLLCMNSLDQIMIVPESKEHNIHMVKSLNQLFAFCTTRPGKPVKDLFTDILFFIFKNKTVAVSLKEYSMNNFDLVDQTIINLDIYGCFFFNDILTKTLVKIVYPNHSDVVITLPDKRYFILPDFLDVNSDSPEFDRSMILGNIATSDSIKIRITHINYTYEGFSVEFEFVSNSFMKFFEYNYPNHLFKIDMLVHVVTKMSFNQVERMREMLEGVVVVVNNILIGSVA